VRHEDQVNLAALEQGRQVRAVVIVANPDPDGSEIRPDHVRAGLPSEEPGLIHGRRLLADSARFLAVGADEHECVVEVLTCRFEEARAQPDP
jgi:hypothetical protein